jgi:hypothetical protein
MSDGFVDALLSSPLGVTLLAALEHGPHYDVEPRRNVSTASVGAAVESVRSMSFGEFLDIAVLTSMIRCGPWIGEAPRNVAEAYRHAEERSPIAHAVNDRFGPELHTSIDRAAQQWWTDVSTARWLDRKAPLFHDFDDVYGAGQFTWAGLWTVTDPPEAVHAQLAAAWEYEVGPVHRWWLPVRPEARVFEIHRPGDWARLVMEHPRQGAPHPEWELPGINQHRSELSSLLALPGQRAARTTIRRHLVPDWRSVSESYDGVHLSWAGFLTAEGCITDLGGGDVAMLRYWSSERTHWLADVFGESNPATDPASDDGSAIGGGPAQTP